MMTHWLRLGALVGVVALGSAEGCMYRQSRPEATRDYAQAKTRYENACDTGSAGGCDSLGLMYYAGKGVTRDYAQAAAFYAKACYAGSAGACADLGDLYVSGQGVARDDAQARELFEKACDEGDVEGCDDARLVPLDTLHVPKG